MRIRVLSKDLNPYFEKGRIYGCNFQIQNVSKIELFLQYLLTDQSNDQIKYLYILLCLYLNIF